nr:hypothetical protein [Tanacetum cinerariifolium]GFC56778.1 hypothetical protein [Tanacetum cinerariifolium]
KREENDVLRNVIALFKLEIGSSKGLKDGTASLKSNCGKVVSMVVE